MTWTWQERRQPRRRRRPQSSRACLPAGRAARRSALTARTSPFTRCIDGRCKPPSTHARRADDDDDDDNGDDRHDADEDDDDGEDDDDDGGGRLQHPSPGHFTSRFAPPVRNVRLSSRHRAYSA